jgi:hypothetical protein
MKTNLKTQKAQLIEQAKKLYLIGAENDKKLIDLMFKLSDINKKLGLNDEWLDLDK